MDEEALLKEQERLNRTLDALADSNHHGRNDDRIASIRARLDEISRLLGG